MTGSSSSARRRQVAAADLPPDADKGAQGAELHRLHHSPESVRTAPLRDPEPCSPIMTLAGPPAAERATGIEPA
jgi:hypothetical protein